MVDAAPSARIFSGGAVVIEGPMQYGTCIGALVNGYMFGALCEAQGAGGTHDTINGESEQVEAQRGKVDLGTDLVLGNSAQLLVREICGVQIQVELHEIGGVRSRIIIDGRGHLESGRRVFGRLTIELALGANAE